MEKKNHWLCNSSNTANWPVFMIFNTAGVKQHIRDKMNFLSRKKELTHDCRISFFSWLCHWLTVLSVANHL